MSADEHRQSMQALGEKSPVGYPRFASAIFAVAATSALRGALGAVYFAYYPHAEPPGEYPLTIVDWEVEAIEGALPSFVSKTASRLQILATMIKLIDSPGISIWAEPRGIGDAILRQGWTSDHHIEAVPEGLAKLDLTERAIRAIPHFHTDVVKIGRDAYEKAMGFRGATRNHLRTQIKDFVRGQDADDAELLSATCLGVLLAAEVG